MAENIPINQVRALFVALEIAFGTSRATRARGTHTPEVAEGDPLGHASGKIEDELAEARRRKAENEPSALKALRLRMAKGGGERTIIPGHNGALHLMDGGNDVPLGDTRED